MAERSNGSGFEDGALRVLVVEDDPVSAKLIERLFRDRGLQVDLACGGAEALELHAKYRYRLVLADWMMPGIDGVELCRRFRQQSGSYVYFILVSARSQRADRTEAFNAGIDDFLAKPIDRDEFNGRIKAAERILTVESGLQIQRDELEASASRQAALSSRFEGLFNGLPMACFTFGRDGTVQDWNQRASEVFGFAASDAVGKAVWDLFGNSDQPAFHADEVGRFFENRMPVSFDWEFGTPEGEGRFFTSRLICVPDISGHEVGAVCANLDITDRRLAERQIAEQVSQINSYANRLTAQAQTLAQMNARLNHLAATDGLTNLWNQRKFYEVLGEVIDQHVRTGEPFSLILVDIDHFKNLNDAYGHQRGDEVLREFADVLRRTARAHELPARYGGEEFAIILRACGVADAMRAAERFRTALENHAWTDRRVTGSFGVATSAPYRVAIQSIVSQADIALYASKDRGRNRVTHYADVVERVSAAS